MNNTKYDWIVVGAGISGIAVAEILCREGKSVLMLEKNDQVASETSKVFHEWLHSGALYSLVPDNLLTMRYLLGAMDDLLEYYSGFSRMNLVPTERGISILEDDGWFNREHIEYRYKIRKLNPIWMYLVSRSLNVIDLINKHDWLRRRAGSEYDSSKVQFKHSFNSIHKQLLTRKNFYSIASPDFTMNSRKLLSDLLGSAMANGLEVVNSSEVKDINESGVDVRVSTTAGNYRADNIVICSPDVIANKFDIPVKTSFAPMAIIENVPDTETSFVELDYYTKSCINLLKKPNGIGQAGGITINTESEIKPYLDYVMKQHMVRNPGIRVLDDYVGLKKELVQNKEQRNYLYHINQHHPKIWSIVLGKFTLAFSMAPEFVRRVYHRNPPKNSGNSEQLHLESDLISKTSWQEIVDKKGK